MKHLAKTLPAILAGLTIVTATGPVSAQEYMMVCKPYLASQLPSTSIPRPNFSPAPLPQTNQTPQVPQFQNRAPDTPKPGKWQQHSATPKQMAFLKRLLGGLPVPPNVQTKGQASSMIGMLIKLKKLEKRTKVAKTF